MAQAFISIGSNVDKEENVQAGVKELQELFGELTVSPVYESKAVGFEGDDFYNLVVGVKSNLVPEKITEHLHKIERKFGREKNKLHFTSRTLDLDLLLYDDFISDKKYLELPRSDIIKYAFVLKPLADIAGDLAHPVTGQCYKELWNSFARELQQSLRPVHINFNLNHNDSD